MKPIRATTHIAAPVERVFAAFADFRNVPGRVSGIKRLQVLGDGPIGVGTRFRETRLMFGREATEEMTITEFDPPRSYSVEAESCGCRYLATYDFRSDGDGTIVDLSFGGQPLTFVAKVMGLLLGWMMAGTMKQCVEKDMLDLKSYLESAGLSD